MREVVALISCDAVSLFFFIAGDVIVCGSRFLFWVKVLYLSCLKNSSLVG